MTFCQPAPAVVVSSLGNLVYEEDIILTAKDTRRAQMLRQVLKAQLGCSRYDIVVLVANQLGLRDHEPSAKMNALQWTH